MNKKLIVTFSVIIIYVIICGLFVKFFGVRHSFGKRFCSSDTEKFSNEFLQTELNKSNFSKLWRKSDNDDNWSPPVYRGRPLCGGMKYVSFDAVVADRGLEHNTNGMIMFEHQIYDQERYCLDKADDIPEGWKLMICDNDVLYHKIFHFAVIILSVLLFGFIIFAYAKYKELRDFMGKAVIGLMMSEILTYLTHSIRFLLRVQYSKILISVFLLGMLQIVLWITVMIVHQFMVFKNFKNAAKGDQNFKIYAIIEIVFTILFTTFIVITNDTRHFSDCLDYLFMTIFFIGAFDVFVLIVIGFMIFGISRKMTLSDQARFKEESNWFWIIVKLSLIMLITWPFQVLDWPVEFDLIGFMVQDSILLLTAITTTIILLGRKKSRNLMMGEYHGIDIAEA